MNNDLEFNQWRAEWHAQVETETMTSAEVRGNAVRQQQRLRAWHVLELASAVVFLVFSSLVVWRAPGVESFLWAAVVWLTTLVVSAFSLWNWRILWKANIKSVSRFTEEYEKRCWAGARAAWFGRWFLIVQVTISASWLTWDYFRHHLSNAAYGGSIVLLLGLTFGFWVFFARYRRAAMEELQKIREARGLLDSHTPASD
jgi:hypothetical protein